MIFSQARLRSKPLFQQCHISQHKPCTAVFLLARMPARWTRHSLLYADLRPNAARPRSRYPFGVLAIRYRHGCGIGIHFSGGVQDSIPLDEAGHIGWADVRRIPDQLAALQNALAGLGNAAGAMAARRPGTAQNHFNALNRWIHNALMR